MNTQQPIGPTDNQTTKLPWSAPMLQSFSVADVTQAGAFTQPTEGNKATPSTETDLGGFWVGPTADPVGPVSS